MSKITAYASLASTQPDDVLPVVDVHDTSMAPSGTTKKIAVSALLATVLPTLAEVAVSASGTLAVNKITEVTATSGALTMTLPASVASSLIVVERAAASTANVAITGNIRGAGSSTITLQLGSESQMLFGDGTTWWPVAGHKTLSSLDARYASVSAVANLNPVNIGFAYLSYNGTALNAIGDGASHPLSGVFATQAAAQTFFAAAVTATGLDPALTDELNWWIIQTYLVDGRQIFAGAGTYLLHRALIIPNSIATGLGVKGAEKGLTVFKLRASTVSGGLNDCSVIIDQHLLAAATGTPGIGYNYNNAITAAASVYLTLEDFTADGNKANVGSGFYAGYNYGIGICAHGDITVSNVDCRNVNGWGYRETGTQITSNTYVERGSYVGLTAWSNAFWGVYIGFRNRKKALVNCIAMNNGTAGLCGSVKGSVQITAPGGIFLDCSEMITENLQAHGNNGDGIYIRNVFACQYKGLRATFNGGAGIHVLGLVNSQGMGWLAQNNGTNPGNGQNNLATVAPDSGGVSSGGAGTYTGAPDVWFDDSTNTYGITTLSQVTGIECGVNTTVTTTWGAAGAETYGLWVDDGIGTSDLALRALHNTSSVRIPASPSSTSLLIGDPGPYYALVTANGNWTCPATGYYRARGTSAGGGAGGGSGGSTTQAGGGAGAAGMPSENTQFVTAGTVVPVTIGAGGTRGTGSSSGTAGSGGQGGNTVIGAPFNITAPGSGPGAGAPAGAVAGAGGIPGIANTGTQRFPGFGGTANSTSGGPLAGGTIGGGQGAPASGASGGNGGPAGTLGGAPTAAGSGTTGTAAGGNGTDAAANSGCGGGGGGGGSTAGTGGTGGLGGSGFAEFWRVG